MVDHTSRCGERVVNTPVNTANGIVSIINGVFKPAGVNIPYISDTIEYNTPIEQEVGNWTSDKISRGAGILSGVKVGGVSGSPQPIAINASNTPPIVLTRPVVQSRINLQNGNNKVGWQHVLNRHFSGSTASQFSISPAELRLLLQDKSVISVPITRTRTSVRRSDGATQTIYERVVQVNKNIGFDKFNNNQVTNIMTIQTDKYGNLITVTPGKIQ